MLHVYHNIDYIIISFLKEIWDLQVSLIFILYS